MCYSLVETRGYMVPDNIDQVVIGHLGMDIEPINIILVFLNSTPFPEIADLVESPAWLVVVAMVLSNCVLDLFSCTCNSMRYCDM